MSNLKYTLYLAGVMRLAKSMVIKHNATALAINAHIKESAQVTGLEVDEVHPETWKYYQNMAGVYHESDELIVITSLDTLERIAFTKENLFKHRGTAREYAFGSSYYNQLVIQNPLQESLIRGIVNPVDINEAISAPDYTIMYFDPKEVEPQEYDLIYKLQEWITRTQDRWIVRDYVRTDPLYPFAVLGKIYSFIPAVINTIRAEALKTFQANTYFIWNYLDSNGYLGKYKKQLTLDQAMWLYRNIGWVNANVGKQSTFDATLEAIMTKRNLPLGSYDVVQNVSLMPLELNPYGEAVRTELNLQQNNATNTTTRTLQYLFEKQLTVAKDNESVLVTDLADATSKFAMTNLSRLPTKVYESDVIDTTNSEPYKLVEVLFNQWIHLTAIGKYTSVINVRNPYTTELMTMTVKDALLMWFYVVNKSMGIELVQIPQLKARSVLRSPLPRYVDLRPLADERLVPDVWIDRVLDGLISIGLVISTETFNELCDLIHANMLEHRLMWATQDERNVRYEMEGMLNRVYETVVHDFYPPGTLYTDYFRTKGWAIETLVPTDCEILTVDLWNLALGIDVSQKVMLKDIQTAMLNIMKQLGTYDTHYIQTINENAAFALDPQHIRIDKPKTKLYTHLGTTENGIDFVKFKAIWSDYWDLKEYTVLDPIVLKAVPHTKIEVELPNLFTTGITPEINIRFELSRINFKWPNVGNVGDLEFSGDLGNIIIKPLESKDLAEVIRNAELDGLHYEE